MTSPSRKGLIFDVDGNDIGEMFPEKTLSLLRLLTVKKIRKPDRKPAETTKETSYRHLLATPLVEVRSIRIESLVNDKRPALCEIYGHVRIINTLDGRNNFTLFQKDKDNPEFIRLGETLSLTTRSPAPLIVPSKYVKLDVLLYDRNAPNVAIAEKVLDFDNTGKECEEDHVKEVYGKDKGTFARVHYTLFQYAVNATIDVLYFSPDDNFDLINDDNNGCYVPPNEEKPDTMDLISYDSKESRDCGEGIGANLYGSVTVRSIVSNGNGKDSHSISLFTKSPENGVHVKSGGFIQLSKSAVVVPAYSSSLLVDVDLSDCDSMKPIVKDVLEFKIQDECTYKKDLMTKQGRVRVRVTWGNAYDLQPYQASENNQRRQKLKEEEFDYATEVQRLEVFSVAVHRKDFKPFSFYGSVGVKDWLVFKIFQKDKSYPQFSQKLGSLAPLKSPFHRSVNAIDYFWIHVDLKDAATGDQISKGYAAWDPRLISPLFDRRLCSVIRGEWGFAAVHYTAFEDAVTAIVEVKIDENIAPGHVYGKIVARYSSYEYSTAYDKKYYQSILFDRPSEDCGSEAQASGSSLRLLKTIVCLPRNSSLIIEADLTICSAPASELDKCPQDSKLLQGSVELKPSGESQGRLVGEASYIDVFVKWSSAIC